MSDVAKTEEAWEDVFLSAYLEEYGTITKAAVAAGVTPDKVKSRIKTSPVFKAKFEAANDVVKDTVRYEVVRRALEPTEKPVYQRGALVGVVREWDNTHLRWVAERLMPQEFHIPTRIEFAGDGEGVVNFKLELNPGQGQEEE